MRGLIIVLIIMIIAYFLAGCSTYPVQHGIHGEWEQEGQKRSKVVIIADQVQLLGGRANSLQDNSEPTGTPIQPQQKERFTDPIPF